ncbi:hypothetical protein BDW74DRAFT_12781 [Aspergillus multicolor]|uniref:uncharacterized protein n=1 Tax=Aspergillus multicolor TaxID=41759 RepID=UPI003CCCC53B
MSFGFSVGRIPRRHRTRQQAAEALRQRPGRVQVAFRVQRLSAALHDINGFDLNENLKDKQKNRLHTNTEACKGTLDSLSALLDKYQDLETIGTGTTRRRRRVWKRLKWDPAPAQDIQRQLRCRIEAFNLFFSFLNAETNLAQNATLQEIHRSQRMEEEEKILKWLSDLDFRAKQTDYIRRRQPGTSEWLSQTAEFRHWVNTPGEMLFCHGIPGAGKTITAAVVVDHLAMQFGSDKSIGIAYIYFDFREIHEIEELFINLLMQLASQSLDLPEVVKDLHEKHKSQATRSLDWEISSANQCVTATFSKVFIVVDALDVCPDTEDYRNMAVDELLKLRTTNSVSLLVTSRPSPDILETFSGEVHIEIQATKEDIEAYVHGHLRSLPRFIQRNLDLQQKITSSISKAADGMFLLAQLYLQALGNAVTPREIKELLVQFQKQPPDQPGGDRRLEMLSKAYDATMGRIQQLPSSQRQLSQAVLMWITLVQEPLSVS